MIDGWRGALGAFLLVALLPAVAPAQQNLVDEVKGGVLVHDIGFLGHHHETGADLNLEVLFASPGFLKVIGAPRPMIGGDINTDGDTSNGYFGLTWTATLVPTVFGWDRGLFVDGGLGGAVHDGYLDHAPPNRKKLGSRILFHLSAELGVQLTARTSVSLFMDHMSNANFARHNGGITSAGLRFGWKF